ncbi:MAG: hypothetical protein OHK0053_11650 [Microscillaceae bacterium]
MTYSLLKKDILAGGWVLMVSLPLSLAIAQAAGFSPAAGLLTLVIGAFLSWLPGASPLSIKAPSVALILILLSAISQLSPYPSTGLRYLLATLVLAGGLQVVSALLRLHLFYRLIPDVVVYGLITGLSVQVFLQQCFGLVSMPVPSQAWWYWFPDLLFSYIYADKQVFALGAGLVLLLFLPVLLGQHFPHNLPGVFWVFLIGLGLGIYFTQSGANLPQMAPTSEGQLYWLFPDFSVVYSWISWEYALLLTLLGTLESQINTQAVEMLDPQRRKSRPNLEMLGQGLGNIMAGCLGALPLSTSIEMSLTNINRQAQSLWSGRFQALLGLALFLTASWWLLYLPTLVLSAILLYVLYRLNSPQLYLSLREIGPDQWFIFLASLVLTLTLGPWAGLGGGFLVAVGVFVYLGCPLNALLYASIEVNQKSKGKTRVFLRGAALGANYFWIQKQLQKLLGHNRIIIDLSECKLVEHGFLEQIYHFAYWNNLNDGRMEIQGLKNHRPLSRHPLSTLQLPSHPSLKLKKSFIELNERQLDIQAIAAVNNTRIETNLTYDGVVLQGFYFAQGYEIRYRENKFMKFHGSNTLEFSDVFLSKGLRMGEQNRKVSVFLVTVMDQALPDFTLSPENLVDKVWQSVGYEDIDFEGHPVFSERFKLMGEATEAIRYLFQNGLVDKLEANAPPNLQIEARQNRLIFHQSPHLLHRVEIEDLLALIEDFLDLVQAKEALNDAGVTT